MSGSKGTAWLLAAAVVLTVVGLVVWMRPAPTDPPAQASNADPVLESQPSAVLTQPASGIPQGYSMVGGIQRPESDVRPRTPSSAKVAPKKRQGFSPALKPDENEQVQLVYKALASGDQPERFSSFETPHNFDSEAFAQSPAEYSAQYAQIVEPGRVFAPAQPAEGVANIRASGSRFHRVRQGESVRLSVKATANAPVTFTSQDLGQFQNKLSSVTVVAGDDGTASANYTATGGTINEVQVLAASPVTSGQIAFTVSVAVGS